MRIGHRPLIFRALMVLEAAIRAADEQPIEAGPAVRLALAYLFAISDGDRSPFDQFFHRLSEQPLPDKHPRQAAYMRTTWATTCRDAIVRSVGFWPSAFVMNEVDAALRDGKIREHEREFWRLVDEQMTSSVCKPQPRCGWLTQRKPQ